MKNGPTAAMQIEPTQTSSLAYRLVVPPTRPSVPRDRSNRRKIERSKRLACPPLVLVPPCASLPQPHPSPRRGCAGGSSRWPRPMTRATSSSGGRSAQDPAHGGVHGPKAELLVERAA